MGNSGKRFSKRKQERLKAAAQGKILKHQCYKLITKGHRVHAVNMCFRQFPATGQKKKYFKDSSQAHHRFLALKMPEKHPKVFGKHCEIQYFYSDCRCLITVFDRQE